MAVWAQITTSQVQYGRLDAQFYRPQFLERSKTLDSVGYKLHRLGRLADKIDVGYVGPMTAEYSEKGILLLRSQNIKEFYVDVDKNPIFIPRTFHQKLKKSEVQPGNILITRSGVAGNVAIVPNGFPTANSADIIIVQLQPIIDPLYVVAFLNSRFGRFQVDRQVSGGLQGHLNLTIAEDILVPEFPRAIQSEIAECVRAGLNRIATARAIYSRVQRMLQEELGVDVGDLAHQVGAQILVSDVLQNGRWDSEFYKMKYQRVLNAVLKTRKVKVEEFASVGRFISHLTNGHTPLHHDLTVGEVPFLTAEHVSDFRIDFSTDKRSCGAITRRNWPELLCETEIF